MKKEKKKKVKNSYIFPNFLAMAMKNAEMKTQLESSMLSMALLLIGMLLMGIYSILYLTQGWIFKGLIIFNLLAGFLFMSSYLVTTYQQYTSYLGALEIQKQMNPEMIEPKRKKSRPNQILFFGGLLIIIASVVSYFVLDTGYWVFGLSVLGFIMMIIPFFRKKDKSKLKTNDKENLTTATISRPKTSFQKLPETNFNQQKEVIKKKLNNNDRRQKLLDAMYQRKLKEMELQKELDQEQQGFNPTPELSPDEEIAQVEQEYQQDQYIDYNQTQSQRKFKGKDGRVYYG